MREIVWDESDLFARGQANISKEKVVREYEISSFIDFLLLYFSTKEKDLEGIRNYFGTKKELWWGIDVLILFLKWNNNGSHLLLRNAGFTSYRFSKIRVQHTYKKGYSCANFIAGKDINLESNQLNKSA